ncbi:Similar to S.cerevisiae protein UBA2 (Subunit of heterodimeric nuclear SUMO activating enzyme E1 with Aos1p) [Malassezia sympodialis ATCC 42132]|uniref:Ubiquitin-activating enzyme E1-like n=1 Tax=Malassezia sympodialis (strain ATCC 42132) TaxID=1230383 RepID=A0A1M8A3Q7_MALS4|nr:Similar to S.cerevisiae protein UBA2 (Subunit of heterodimeric nuclear SUMO activating enzyme E1 with Aos1p) [Malassezia sympodialis ATCC 42132]
MASSARYNALRAALGPGELERIRHARILVVGAGGIGCELLKDLVLVGVGHVDIIDLDTIDLSNLNRQFLFQKQHIRQSKAVIAKETASAFNPDVSIVAHHANIKAPEFDIAFYASFDVVLNALDNLETRRWVNRMCVMARVPMIESGTAGFLGQVQPIRVGHTECYDCTAHPTPTTFPVCTIRSTPSTPVHCIVWAKNWLFPQLFGNDAEAEADEQELDQAQQRGENIQELENLRREAQEMRALRQAAANRASAREACERIFDKVYRADMERLLSMEDMWAHRRKPVPLSLAQATQADPETAADSSVPTLRDRRPLTLRENALLFLDCAEALAKRAIDAPQSFDKDDDEALGFVTAAANLRAHVYGIQEQTRFETKQIAGNIIPAIATTNAMVAGLVTMQALHVLAERWDALRVISLARRATRVFTTFAPAPPHAECGVCQDVFVRVAVNPADATLQHLVDVARQDLGYGDDAFFSISVGTRILYDADLEDNVDKTLQDLHVETTDVVSIADEDHMKATAQLVLERGSEPCRVLDRVSLPEKRRAARPIASDAQEADEVRAISPPPVPAAPREAPAKRAREADESDTRTKRVKAADDVIVLD